MVTHDQVIGRLVSQPLDFLSRHYVDFAAGIGAASVQTWYISPSNVQPAATPDPIFGRLHMHQPVAFRFTILPPAGVPATGYTAVDAMRIPVEDYGVGGVGAIVGATVPLAAAAFIFTGRLTGCTFCWLQAAHGTIVCAHQRPPAGTNPDNMCTNISNHGAFLGQVGALTCFGSGHGYDANTQEAVVLGMRIGGAWQLYAQVRPLLTQNITQAVRLI